MKTHKIGQWRLESPMESLAQRERCNACWWLARYANSAAIWDVRDSAGGAKDVIERLRCARSNIEQVLWLAEGLLVSI